VDDFPTWSIAAVNLPEHADNPVHTVEGGLAAGYAGAVVAGTTVFAYLTRPVAEAWGRAWVAGGGHEVWFRGPVLADEPVEVSGGPEEVVALVGDRVCARLVPERSSEPPVDPTGDRLEPLVVELDDRWVGYAARAGEDLGLYAEEGLVHPSVWPSLANRVFATQLVDGAWVHTRSRVRHLGAVAPGATVVIESWEVDRFETRSGQRAVVDIRMTVDGRLVCAVEHEAIVRLSG
jgi:acyl dehydratase